MLTPAKKNPMMTLDAAAGLRVLSASADRASPAGVAVLNSSGAMLFVNQKVSSIFGYEPGELLFRNVSMILRDFGCCSETGDSIDSERWRALTASEGVREVTAIRKDGSQVPIGLTIRTIADATETLTVASHKIDLSSRREIKARTALTPDHARIHRMVRPRHPLLCGIPR